MCGKEGCSAWSLVRCGVIVARGSSGYVRSDCCARFGGVQLIGAAGKDGGIVREEAGEGNG